MGSEGGGVGRREEEWGVREWKRDRIGEGREKWEEGGVREWKRDRMGEGREKWEEWGVREWKRDRIGRREEWEGGRVRPTNRQMSRQIPQTSSKSAMISLSSLRHSFPPSSLLMSMVSQVMSSSL